MRTTRLAAFAFMKTIRDVATMLCRNIHSPKEVDHYLKTFASATSAAASSQRFAVIKVGGDVVKRELDTLASSVSFLSQQGELRAWGPYHHNTSHVVIKLAIVCCITNQHTTF